MKIAYGNKRTDKLWKNSEITWDEFCDRLKTPIITTESVSEYQKMPKSQQADIKDVGGFVAGHLKQGRRKKGHVLSRSMVTLDMDFGTVDIWEELTLLFPYRCLLYSTHSHRKDNPRYRFIIPLSRDVSPEEYGAVARMLAKEIGIDLFDVTTYDVERLMYWPSVSKDGDYLFDVQEGPLLNPDDVLTKYDDWTDITTWPVSSKESQVIKTNDKTQKDPLEKEGIVGAFCRTYSITETIDTFLSDIYQSTTIPNRYDHVGSESSAGVVVYDDKFVYSHHASDPAGGKLLNAFDLVRVHKFGDDDKKDMWVFASQDDAVKRTLLEERKQQAILDFSSDDDWMKKLTYHQKTGVIENTLRNLMLILENDDNLKSLVFNQLLDGMEIKGSVPWKHPSKYWRDADDAQLISYIDLTYGTFSSRNYDIAVTKITDDRSYHPIRDYLEALPEWDKIERVDTLLIDYLGAPDNEYVRAITRKMLCAAVKRVQQPGCKFDTMLVLNGPQGVGKSTLISKLAGEWFSDSLHLSDTKDKTAAEKLQGYWILEIGELAGLRKAEVETLRSFLSRQNDVYRAAFGRRATQHPRQCIFIGTTNAETGYLRDTTGNRRFWPVQVNGNGNKQSWALTSEDVSQIWAEVKQYVDAGEKLYLDEKQVLLAKEEQREAMEADEREGLVKDYLDLLLPENWHTMSLYERRNYINGESEFGDVNHKGIVVRDSVCTLEIWCECFGKERANIKRTDSNDIISILIKLGWIREHQKKRFSIYGPQYFYVPKSCS
ncbi:hypothetical protein H1220_04410 [Carnobacteriaceae bacterium zg-84]|uniref:virulence-associated E family protein n=1 Tax=Granulicatella sp. zg-84 TaxID=2678503 RepID=UPI0013BECCE2|nr:virulence-associated E family protein [Granulicatella sp. zg-84]NEW66063.1 hypothetical protein [Granulicatella sp. zg-84]QMI86593.1 hypothetical protein H1220_04410 [Carnobacteriaceae bacterium zg-84]